MVSSESDACRLSPKPNAPFDTMNLMYNVSLGADFGEHLGAELMLSQTDYNLDISGLGIHAKGFCPA